MRRSKSVNLGEDTDYIMSMILIGTTKNKRKISVCKNCEEFAEVPHFMYENDNKRELETVSILEARLIDSLGNLELEEREDLEIFLSSTNDKYNMTNWEVIKKVWNENNKTQIPKYSHKPYYRNLIEYVDSCHFSDYDRDERLECARVYCEAEIELEPHFHYVLPDGSDIAISFLEAEYLYPLKRKLTEREIENLITFLKGSHSNNRWNCTNWKLGIITWNRQNYRKSKGEWESIYPNHKKLDENLQMPDYRLLNK